MEESIFNFLRDILLFRFPENLDAEARAEHTHFVLKFQQTTGPIMAKGLEDTVFYIYNRLAALNEVGGEPQQFGLSVEAFHERNIDRQRNWPATLLATSTHDTKRSEDVRARIVAISEIPELWRRSLQRWRVANRRWKRTINDAEAPDANEEYLLYQTLLGTWPMQVHGEPEARQRRITSSGFKLTWPRRFMKRRSTRVGSSRTKNGTQRCAISSRKSWIRRREINFSQLSFRSQKRLRDSARLIHSRQTLLKLTSPGVPDIYQGNEIWDYSLVDPDNRRPVDYQRRREMLESLATAHPHDLVRNWADGRIKMFLTQRVLQFRRKHAELFQKGEYLPLTPGGAFAECCVSFARQLGDQWIVIIAPRLSSRVGFPPIAEIWQDTTLEIPETLSLEHAHDLFTCRPVSAQDRRVKLADALSVLPFAVITNL